MPEKVIAILDCKEGIVKMNFWDPWHRSEDNVFDTWLCCRGHGNRVTVAPKTGRYPKDVDFRYRMWSYRIVFENS